jgi:aminoglycoside phosphotransferase family enzyme
MDAATSRKVAALREPAAYPEPLRQVQAVETHMSWVFLTDEHAYKLKKPVRVDHHDFRSRSSRRLCCLEELRLNRRLAPDVYLDVVPLVADVAGRLRVAGPGTVVDWLVKMRRLAAGSMLDALLARRAAGAAHMEAVAGRMAAFHAAQAPAALGAQAWRAQLLRRIDECEEELCRPLWRLPAPRIRALCAAQRTMLSVAAALFDARHAAGRVIEGHGDLRPEHVNFGPPLVVIDCLEFSAELRTLDAADEIGYLALECERAGAAALAAILLQAWRRTSGDAVPATLLHFYQSCRATGRARLAILHLREARYRATAKWRRRALRYLVLALRHMRACELPVPVPAALTAPRATA